MLPYNVNVIPRDCTTFQLGSVGTNVMNSSFTHSWFVPADLCVPYKRNPQITLLEPGHVIVLNLIHKYLLFFFLNEHFFRKNELISFLQKMGINFDFDTLKLMFSCNFYLIFLLLVSRRRDNWF